MVPVDIALYYLSRAPLCAPLDLKKSANTQEDGEILAGHRCRGNVRRYGRMFLKLVPYGYIWTDIFTFLVNFIKYQINKHFQALQIDTMNTIII